MSNICPYCRHLFPELRAANDPRDHPPRPGDVSLCFECGCWCVFARDGLRTPTRIEQDSIDLNRSCRRLFAAWLLIHPRVTH